MRLLVFVSTLNNGGVATVVLNQVRACARLSSEFHIDFACCVPPSPERSRELEKLGATAYKLTSFSSNPLAYCKDARRAIYESECDAVHVHLGHLNWLVCCIAKSCGVEKRIMHSHSPLPRSSSVPFKIAMALAPSLNRRYATAMFACSEAAGIACFGTGFEFLPNIVEFPLGPENATPSSGGYDSEFSYDVTQGLRLGFMGALDANKRPEFVLTISERLAEEGVEHCLFIAGDGPRRREIEALAAGNPHVRVLGQRNDPLSLIRYFDYLLMPSVVEGMSLSVLEAQLSGTMCIASDSIPGTNDLGFGLFRQLPCDNPEGWANLIKGTGKDYKVPTKAQMMRRLAAIGYDSDSVARRLLVAYGIKQQEQ